MAERARQPARLEQRGSALNEKKRIPELSRLPFSCPSFSCSGFCQHENGGWENIFPFKIYVVFFGECAIGGS
jgi:hypothetical protein